MAENTLQFEWIVTIESNLEALFVDDPNVFVAGDNLIYPVKGEPATCQAPDVYVAFGRPKGHRGSYKVFEEGGIFPQVIFEVLSPSNTLKEMKSKRAFYRRYGVEEYYVLDPYDVALEGWLREGRRLVEIEDINGFRSPRLGIRFQLTGENLVITGPTGDRFLTFVELKTKADQEKQRAEQEKQRAEQEKQRAEQEKQRAEQEKQRAEQEKQRAEQALQENDRLRAALRGAGIDPDRPPPGS
jgi:Uma2 family endonuclease